MASTATIPRFLLPQYGAIWRTATRAAPLPRPRNTELSRFLVRYATSKSTAAAKSTSTTTTAAAAKKVAAPKAASTRAATSKASTGKPASTRVSPPTSTPAKPTAAAKAPAAKAAATPKTPASQSTTQKAAASAKAAAANPAAAKPAAPALKKTSTPDPSKPLILEKPERFNPPSHGSRLPRSTPKHYGGALTSEEVQAQKTKEYPGLPPPETTWAHWFLNSKTLHMLIALTTLFSLAFYTFALRFNATSPFAHMVPPISEFPSHPIEYIRTCLEVLRLHEEHESAITAEKRRKKVEDVAKRNEYRKAHGLDTAQGIESWTGIKLAEDAPAPVPASGDPTEPPSGAVEEVIKHEVDLGLTPEGKRKKFWGIF
ncbi:hypothetical protein BX600DRAFT_507039 [Xylariales sp. PMI_506]|nr:hypothetical protein BX600DRAFT_507039 [Xylariales sp. PMI_506]